MNSPPSAYVVLIIDKGEPHMKTKPRKHIGTRLSRMLFACFILTLSVLMTVTTASAASSTEAETHVAVPYQSQTSADALRPNGQPVSYGLKVLAAREEMVFTGLCGNEITLTAEDIMRAMNLSELNYVTVTKLPAVGEGTLYAGSVGATEGQSISAGSISYLSFAAADDEKPCEATMTLAVNGGGYDITCRFILTDRINYTPTVSLAPEITLHLETYSDMKTFGTLSAYDPEGDEMTYEIVRHATHGRVYVTDKHTGAYTYIPDSGYVGNDAFTYVVRDAYGNYSTSAVINVKVSGRPNGVSFADVENSEAAPSILRVSAMGLMNGTQVGANAYFKPDQAMSRIEFLVTAMHAAGITSKDVAGLNAPSFADADEIPEAMAKYVSLAVRRGYVAGKEVDGQLCFCPDETISRAEAAVILSNIIGYATQTTVTAFADVDAMPTWSLKAMNSLKSLGILMPSDGNADARSLMTRADTAVWLDRTIRVITQA